MKESELNRRDFSKLTAAAFGGMLAGSAIGCGGGDDAKDKPESKSPKADLGADSPEGDAKTDVSLLMSEPHVCRGLNMCKNQGASKMNECAGQGTCATAEHHTCHFANKCKGQGGCGDTAGLNSCSEKGECGVPLNSGTWKKVRAKFVEAMEAEGKKVGEAPAAG